MAMGAPNRGLSTTSLLKVTTTSTRGSITLRMIRRRCWEHTAKPLVRTGRTLWNYCLFATAEVKATVDVKAVADAVTQYRATDGRDFVEPHHGSRDTKDHDPNVGR
jgi:hypothetical protein